MVIKSALEAAADMDTRGDKTWSQIQILVILTHITLFCTLRLKEKMWLWNGHKEKNAMVY